MPGRTGNTYTTPTGVVTRSKSGKAKSYTGKGPAPAGTRKTPEKSYSEVPTVTVSSDGTVSTSGYSAKSAARAAQQAQKRRSRRVRAILAIKPPKAQKASQPVLKSLQGKPRDLPKPKLPDHYIADPSKAVISSSPNPVAKPLTFKGQKTAGSPTRSELQKAAKAGSLKTNRKGFVTTPRVRQVSGQVKKLKAKAQKSTGPLPNLGPQESHVARKVLKTGVRSGATKKELLAAAETGLVESGFKNLGYGDADSEGWRQERTSIYGTGPTGPRNVKASARRFFQESVSDTGGTRGAGQTAGQLAQTIQGSAFPERYDERKPEAAAIVKGVLKGSLKPAQQKRLQRAEAEARSLGLKSGGKTGKGRTPSGPSHIPSVVYIGHQAEKKFGLSVGENPAFGGVTPVHVEDSYHYRTDKKGRGEAIDVSGDPEKMMAFDQWVAKRWGQGVTELFYDPGISIKEGTEIGSIGGHEDHVHVAVAMPGEKIAGGMAGSAVAGPGGAVFVGYGSTASAASASAESARTAAAKGKAAHVSPWQRYWRTTRKLARLSAPAAAAASQGGTTVAELQRKYGKAAV